ncbi:MAG: DUF4783 domain-containing protein [Flammeovirgaceae bacterium]
MNLKNAFVLFVFGFCTVVASAQGELFNSVKEAIKANNAKEMVKFFNPSVDINIEGDINNYSRAQAEFVLRDFFKKHPASDFNVLHTGSSPNGLKYAIGKFLSGADSYNVLIRVRETGKQFLVHEISFIKE